MHFMLIVICVLLSLPALYALQVATLTFTEALQSNPPQLFPPSNDFFNNVQSLFDHQNFGHLLVNTFIVAMVVVIGKTITAMLAGSAFVYFKFPGKSVLFFFVLLTLLMPTEIILLPLFRLVADLEWGDKNPRLALTIPFLASATGAFLFRQHFSNIPRELAEAAQIDGASPLRFMTSVLLPMSWNVIVAHSVIQFVYMWNQYVWPSFIVSDYNAQMIQVAVRRTVNLSAQTDFGVLMSAGVIASLPPLILFILVQKQFMSGFALTRDK
ncbi:MAG: carbohydrate ABC transporter permease [Chloroflexi bacterium]|nr:carbohydrate ABC transporter permease [Chloroflexota bacterium]